MGQQESPAGSVPVGLSYCGNKGAGRLNERYERGAFMKWGSPVAHIFSPVTPAHRARYEPTRDRKNALYSFVDYRLRRMP
jgi:hypothetical protein